MVFDKSPELSFPETDELCYRIVSIGSKTNRDEPLYLRTNQKRSSDRLSCASSVDESSPPCAFGDFQYD